VKLFVKQLFLLLLSSLTVYAALLCVSLAVVPPQQHVGGLDTAYASRSLFATEPKYVFLNRSGLDTTREKVLLLGASNVLAGFRQDQLQQLVPGAEINNLGVGGSNVTQLLQIVDLVHEVQGVEARKANIFVIGTWYGLFADDLRRWRTPDRHPGDTDIDIERYRYGFFRRTATGPVAVLPPEWLKFGVYFLHPYLVVDKLLRDATKSLRRVMAGKSPELTDASRNAAIVDERERRRYLAFWEDYMGGNGRLSDDQFYVMAEMVRRISRAGGRVIIADLPLPAWHAERSPYHAEYRQRTQQLFKTLAMLPGVQAMRVGDSAGDAFTDEVHPKPETTAAWAVQLATVLNGRGREDRVLPRNLRAADAVQQSVIKTKP
jgi:hypothetical protein